MQLDDKTASLVSAHLPGADASRVRLLGSGWNAVAWRITAGNGDWVARIPRTEWAAGEIERQACLNPALARHGIPVPIDWSLIRDESGAVAAGLYRYVEGAPAPVKGHATRRLVRPVATLLEHIHTFPAEKAVTCGAERFEPWDGRWRPLIATHGNQLPPASRDWVADAARRLESLCHEAGTPVFIHGDLQPAHLLLDDEGEIQAVLDFSGPFVTDAAVDFGRLVQFFNAGFARRVLATYSLPVDAAFWERACLYAALEPLRTIAFEIEFNRHEWTPWALRQLAASARSHT